jgi:tetratricopeptide (TPR) repeat protein
MPVVGRQIAASLTYRPHILSGAPEEAFNLLRREANLGRADAGREFPQASGYRALCLAHMGQLVSARRTLHRLLSRRDIGIDEGLTPANLLAVMLETATAIGDRPTVALLAGKLEPAASLFLFHAGYASVARLLGAAMTVVGDYDKALTWFRSALDAANYAGVRPEAALTRLQLAELFVANRSDDGTEVKNLLQQAITELADMNMRPGMERAQGLLRAAIG